MASVIIVIIIIVIIAQSNCGASLERYRKVVSRDWCGHMLFGIIAESVLTGYSQNLSQSLGHLRPQVVT